MFKEFHNECRIALRIEPVGPVLVKAGVSQAASVDMAFVRTYRGGQPAAYLPGSALKGICRSHAERIGRTLDPNKICNPFNTAYGKRNNSPHGVPACSNALNEVTRSRNRQRKNLPPSEAYRSSCPACRLFGALGLGGRFNIDDAYAVDGHDPVFEYRDGVGIDRFSGGAVSGAKYQFEVITSGAFETVLSIRNFELWQLSWMTLVLRDMEDGLVPIGFGTSRGLGKVKTTVQHMEIDIMTREAPQVLSGLNHSYRGGDASSYGFADEQPLALPDGVVFQSRGMRQRVVLQGDQREQLWDDLAYRFADFLDGFEHMQNWRMEQRELQRGGRR